MPQKLLILGDSISLGVAEIRGNEVASHVDTSYVDLLRDQLDDVQIVVDADTHRTTSAAVKLIDALLRTHQPDVVLIMLGGNDGDIDWRRFVLSNGDLIRSRSTVEIYGQNIRELVSKISRAGALSILTDMPNQHFELRGPYISSIAGKDVCAMIERGGGQAANDAGRAKYRDAVLQVAIELTLPVARYGLAMEQYPGREMVGIDGAHPSVAGHRVIADAILPVLSRVFSARREFIQGLAS